MTLAENQYYHGNGRTYLEVSESFKVFPFCISKMNGNRASGLRKGYAGTSLHGGNHPDQEDIAMKGDFRQAPTLYQK